MTAWLDVEAATRAELVREIDRLQAENDALREASGLDSAARVQAAFGVTHQQARILILLSDERPHSYGAIFAGLYYDAHDFVRALNTLKVQLCRLRGQMTPRGLSITTLFGNGLQLTAGAEQVRAAMRGQPVAVAA